MAQFELKYNQDLVTLLKSGDKVLLKSNNWDKNIFEKRIFDISSFFPETKEHTILFYFTHHYDWKNHNLANMHPPYCPIGDAGNSELEELREKRPDIFIINFWRDMFSIDDISQSLNYAHELQHVSQFITSEKYYWFSRISYCLVDGFQEEELPTEVDAERKTKIILNQIYGQKILDEWINIQLDKNFHAFFIRFKEINMRLIHGFITYNDTGVAIPN